MGRRMKHTDIGDIPADWKLQTFEETFRVLSNNTLSRENLNNKGGAVRNIHYGDILTKFPEVLNCNEEDIPYLNDLSLITVNTQLLQDGDVVIADTAEDDTVGKTIEVQNLGNGKLVAGLHTIPCRVKKGDFAPGWLGYYMNSHIYHDQIIPFITGIKVSSISKSVISETIILIPPVEEQKRIVETLSQIDKLIKQEKIVSDKLTSVKAGCLSKMISKVDEKKPKMRYPEFTDDWEQFKLSDIVGLFGGNAFSSSDATTEGARWLKIANVGKGCIKWDEESFLPNSYIDKYSDYCLKSGDYVMALTRPILNRELKIAEITEDNILLNQRVAKLLFLCDNKFGYQLFRNSSTVAMIENELAGTDPPNLSVNILSKIYVMIPNLEEQRKIGEYFRKFDTLITVHQHKYDKYINIKLGLISKLISMH